MNQQNMSKAPDLLVKRKRGRPRKDESTLRNVKQHTQPPLAMAARPPPLQSQPQPPVPFSVSNNANKVDPSMVGQAVTCVIDGIFENGYLLSACLGPNNTVLRGIVFQQGHVAPVTPANDVAPHVEMHTRGEFPIPPANPRNQVQISVPDAAKQPAEPVSMQSYQSTPAMMTGGSREPVPMQNYQNTPAIVMGGSSSSLLQESLRLVAQDDIMQVFEVSKTVEISQDCDQRAKEEQRVVSDPTAEKFIEGDTIVHKDTELEPVVDASVNEQCANEPDGEKQEVITPVETVVENQASMANDGLQQEIQDHTGEMSNINANQEQNQERAVDLCLSNFPEI